MAVQCRPAPGSSRAPLRAGRILSPEIDLRSDTVTQPSEGMRRAIAEAVVGDDVLEDDPTTNAFQDRIAALFGKEAALFFPSGTQANQTALSVHSVPGCEMLVEANCHIVDYEDGAAAALSGIQLRRIFTPDGLLTPELVAEAFRPDDPFYPPTRAVLIENTHLDSGGRVLSPAQVGAIADVARERGAAVHIDGARIWNAAARAGVEVREYARHVDTVMACLSKGLGAPVGSILAGTKDFIEHARRIRRRFGGAMRQTGLLTAACDYALDHNLSRIGEDHARAARFAALVGEVPGLGTTPPETNIVFIHVDPSVGTAEHVILDARARGVRFSGFGPQRIRAVTHLAIDDASVDRAVEALRGAVGALA